MFKQIIPLSQSGFPARSGTLLLSPVFAGDLAHCRCLAQLNYNTLTFIPLLFEEGRRGDVIVNINQSENPHWLPLCKGENRLTFPHFCVILICFQRWEQINNLGEFQCKAVTVAAQNAF